MLETKVIQVRNDPQTINEVNAIWGSFGWEVINVQITYSQNTETYTKLLDYVVGTGVNTVETTTVNYATITYQRDTNGVYYSQKAELEREFQRVISKMDSLENDEIPGQAGGKFLVKCGVALCILIGLGQLMYFDSNRILMGMLVAVLGPIAINLIYKNTKGKEIEKIKMKRGKELSTLKQRFNDILEQAESLR